jgi:Tfp pilus assembly protein PilE
VPIPWLFYRRQFLYAFVWFAASVGLSRIPGVGLLAWIASIILFGIYGDRIILSRAWKSADSALRQHGPGEKAIAEGAASGGVSMVALVLFLVLIPGVAIVGIMAAIAVPNFARMKQQAYRAEMLSDLRNLRTAEEVVFSDKAKYAADLPGLIQATGVSRPRITLSADSTGFVATVTRTLTPGVTCAIAVNMPNPVDSAAPNGDPVCK